jgi:hypothetical protein
MTQTGSYSSHGLKMAAIYILSLTSEYQVKNPVKNRFHLITRLKMTAISLLTLTLEPMVDEPKPVPLAQRSVQNGRHLPTYPHT